MLYFSFKRGLRFLERSRVWTLVRGDDRGRYRFENDSGGVETLRPSEVLERFVCREWIVDEESVPKKTNIFYLASPRDFASYSEAAQTKPKWIKKCIDFVEKRGVSITQEGDRESPPGLAQGRGQRIHGIGILAVAVDRDLE